MDVSTAPRGNAVFRLVKTVSDAFAFPLKASHYIELVNPLWADHTMQARIEKVWDETSTARTPLPCLHEIPAMSVPSALFVYCCFADCDTQLERDF
ncbi:MAG TPA: hypothetical protein VGE55_12190 [Limnobacter sp.]|uniref:hypothetical protein n=1 Tax=Limnobacter sp. TaxID=2003368 RepID=UPI002EDB518D